VDALTVVMLDASGENITGVAAQDGFEIHPTLVQVRCTSLERLLKDWTPQPFLICLYNGSNFKIS
jgi:hypothetical protein